MSAKNGETSFRHWASVGNTESHDRADLTRTILHYREHLNRNNHITSLMLSYNKLKASYHHTLTLFSYHTAHHHTINPAQCLAMMTSLANLALPLLIPRTPRLVRRPSRVAICWRRIQRLLMWHRLPYLVLAMMTSLANLAVPLWIPRTLRLVRRPSRVGICWGRIQRLLMWHRLPYLVLAHLVMELLNRQCFGLKRGSPVALAPICSLPTRAILIPLIN